MAAFRPMPATRRHELIQKARAEYHWGEPGHDPLLVGLDGKHAYLRNHGSPTEESRAIVPMCVLFGMHLEDLGWSWTTASDNAVSMLAPGAALAVRLSDAVRALLDRDDANFSWLSRQLQGPGASRLPGVVVL